MHPVPRLAEQIAREWTDELSAHLGVPTERLSAMDFPGGLLRIELMDGSCAEFRYAFHLVSEHKRAIAVFTEHCGYHVFPYHDAKVFRDGVLVFDQSD